MRDPWLAVRDELLAARSARLEQVASERRWARATDRASIFRGRDRDPAADRRCAAIFGMGGGECGCGELGCRPCEASPAGACPCAAPACDHWPRQANTRFRGKRVRWKPPQAVWAPPAPFQAATLAGSGGLGSLSRPEDAIDFHAHMPVEPPSDWDGDRSAMAAAVAELGVVDPPAEFQAICVSANPGYTPGTWHANPTLLNTTADLNALTSAGMALDPRILPFAFVPSYEMVDTDAATPIDQSKVREIEALIDAGFVGIGEILVRGHLVDDSEGHGFGVDPESSFELLSQALLPYLALAARNDVPVLFHWDLLTTDDGVDAAMSRQQLLDLLELTKNGFSNPYEIVESERRVVKIVIAHCGDGPTAPLVNTDGLSESSDAGPSYKELVDTILTRHPAVYFDLSGMQVGQVKHLFTGSQISPNVTDLGEFLLRRMADHPTRFLYGSDYGQAGTGNTFAAALADYEAFLSAYEPNSAINRRAFFRDNALEVLYSAPRKPAEAVADLDGLFDWRGGFEAPGMRVDLPPYVDRAEFDRVERFLP